MSPRQHNFIESRIFFKKMGASPQPLHQNDAHGCFLLHSNRIIIDHGLHKVASNISHLKSRMLTRGYLQMVKTEEVRNER
jgi:hypothetical protein